MDLVPPTARLSLLMQARQSARDKAEVWHRLFAELPRGLVTVEQTRLAALMGTSTRTVRRLHGQWMAGGCDPAALIDRRLSPDRTRCAVSPEFVEYWKAKCEANARKSSPAYRDFLREWRSGAPIPGVGPEVSRLGPLPAGLSRQNLRRHAPSTFELKAARVGRTAAASFRPLNYTTRVGLEVGREIMFDDMWHDFQVVVIGQRRPCRLLQLHAHDVFSACQFARGIKPRIEDPESGKSVGLRAGDMICLMAHTMESFGYHPDGTRLILENGTATLSQADLDLLADLTGGKVTAIFASMQSAAAFAGQYGGRGKGNFRLKASLESSHNLIHNETAGLLDFPGQTGSNSRINAPEQLAGQQAALDFLQRAIAALPPRVAAELRLPFIEASKAIWAIEEVMERINSRTDHDLEGWIEAGLTTIDYQLPGGITVPALQVAQLPPDKRAAIEAVAQPVARRMSPREVLDAGRSKLIRFRPEQTARLLVGVCGREVKVGKNRLITVEDAELSPSPIRYLAHTRNEGDVYRAVLNPYNLQHAHLFDAGNRWVGTAKLWHAVSRVDEAGMRERIAEASEIGNLLLQPIARRGAALMKKRLDDLEHNTAVVRRHQEAANDLGAAADAAIQNAY